METFGEYISNRREQLGLQQDEVDDFSQPYISDIECGRKRPARRKTIAKLAKALQLRDDQVTWLWVYSLLNEEPKCFFERYGLHIGKTQERGVHIVKEELASYTLNNNSSRIIESDTPADIRAKLGPPDKNLHFKNKRKWIYHDLGLQVLFEDDQVVDVVFK